MFEQNDYRYRTIEMFGTWYATEYQYGRQRHWKLVGNMWHSMTDWY
jgi:hypothetical protein